MSGLFGELVGSVLSGATQGATSGSGGSSAVIQAVIGLIQQHGGVGGLVEQFQKAGLGGVVQSWVGSGQNLPIDPAQITQVLGGGGGLGGLGQIAQALGMDHGQLGGLLSEVLPQVVDQMTPNGRVEPGAGAGADALGSLAKQLGGKLFG